MAGQWVEGGKSLTIQDEAVLGYICSKWSRTGKASRFPIRPPDRMPRARYPGGASRTTWIGAGTSATAMTERLPA